jgi:hypothetical protein
MYLATLPYTFSAKILILLNDLTKQMTYIKTVFLQQLRGEAPSGFRMKACPEYAPISILAIHVKLHCDYDAAGRLIRLGLGPRKRNLLTRSLLDSRLGERFWAGTKSDCERCWGLTGKSKCGDSGAPLQNDG